MPRQRVVSCVEDLSERLSLYAAFASLGEDPAAAFPDVVTKGLVRPTHALRAAINWAWLKWHDSRDFAAISTDLAGVVLRGVSLYELKDFDGPNWFRDLHDVFLVQAAVLSGRPDVMRRAAEAARPASSRTARYQFFEAWTGILTARILGDASAESRQHALYRTFKPDRTFLWPGAGLVDTFVARDYAAFAKAVKSGCERQWKMAERQEALSENTDGSLVVRLSNKHQHFFWSYVEATFAKLAMSDGAEVSYDSFWFPNDFAQRFAD